MILLHPGQYQADETVAAALIKIKYPHLQIIRRTATVADLENGEVWVLDQGRKYEPSKKNFDHHQDAALDSTVCLVGQHLYGHLPWYPNLYEMLLKHISRGDKGQHGHPASINFFISATTALPDGFEKAFSVAHILVKTYIAHCQKSVADTGRWDELVKEHGFVIDDTGKRITGWKKLAAMNNAPFLVAPNNSRGGWQLICSNSELYPLPVFPNASFSHGSKHLCVFQTREEAIAAARYAVELHQI